MLARISLLRLARCVVVCLQDTYDGMNPQQLAMMYRLFQLVGELRCGPTFRADLEGLMANKTLKNVVCPSIAETTVFISTFIEDLVRVFPTPLCKLAPSWGERRVVLGPHTEAEATIKKRSLLARHIAGVVGDLFPAVLDILEYTSLELDRALEEQCSVEALLVTIDAIYTLSMNALWSNDADVHALHHRLCCAVMHASFPELECPKAASAQVLHNDLIIRYDTDHVTRVRESMATHLPQRPHTSPDGSAAEPFLCKEAATLPFFAEGWFLAAENSSGIIKAVKIPTPQGAGGGDDTEPFLVVDGDKREPTTLEVASLDQVLAAFGNLSVVTFYSMATL